MYLKYSASRLLLTILKCIYVYQQYSRTHTGKLNFLIFDVHAKSFSLVNELCLKFNSIHTVLEKFNFFLLFFTKCQKYEVKEDLNKY